MARTSREQVRAVRYNVLVYIERRKRNGRKSVSVSYREMERALGYSSARVRWACRHLVDEGLLESSSCFDEDGGQRANAYALTRQGREFVKGYRRAIELARERNEAQGPVVSASSPANPDRQRLQAAPKA
ncbi:hypothetical protein [Eggerthella timonensis]|uniref:hypothetical protein n=1 Tax=Eggerthella timonensis TaxID=1871008 RepID=UPI0011AF9C32|nr:hypothetical protein [Eggerthella timonensis]